MTISEGEAHSLTEASGPVPREAAQRVLNYLIFHRSLLSDGNDGHELVDRYFHLVHDLKEGVHIVIADPFQKATALLFELVMGNEFDPWEIDLVRFTEVYLERVRTNGGVDFAVAGRLLYMAWNILYLQSQEILTQRDRPPETAAPFEDDGSGGMDDGYLGDLSTPEAVDVTTSVLEGQAGAALSPMINHPETRPVSLIELVEAFGQAEAEARAALRIDELRDRLREQQRAPPEVLVHGDVPERDLADVWNAVLAHPKDESFPFLNLWRAEQGRDRLVAVFLASLFLSRERVLDLEQSRLMLDPVTVVRRTDERGTQPQEPN
jgi:segregation and condensation protein A